MPGYHNLNPHFSRALHHLVKILYFEPKQYPVSVRPIVAIADRTVVVFYTESVELQNKLAVPDQLLIF